MPIQDTFTIPSQEIASYNFVDLVRRTGYITLYGAEAQDASGTGYTLFEQVIANTSESDAYTQTSTSTDIDFDKTFAVPIVLNGDLILEYCSTAKIDGAGQTGTATTTVDIYHVDTGATETSISTQVVHVVNNTQGSGAEIAGMATIIMPITNQLFKVGETLRISINLARAGGTGGNNYARLWHEPQDVSTKPTGGYCTSLSFKVGMPVKIRI